MWNDIKKHLSNFESAVLTGVDAEGYPFSVRCRPDADDAAEVLRVQLPAGMPLQAGPASLLCHKHDENLWKLRSFLVRGALSRDEKGWKFEPLRFIPGAGIGGLPATVRFFTGSRRNAARYLKKRGLARPRIPWDEINAVKSMPLHLPKGAGELLPVERTASWLASRRKYLRSAKDEDSSSGGISGVEPRPHAAYG